MRKNAFAVMVVAALAAGCAANARAVDADFQREAKDRVEIEDLMWRYVRALDSMNADAYASVYTEDGQFGTGPNAAKGREALKKIVTDVKARRAEREAKGEKSAPMHHVIANSHLEFIDKDHARMESYWMTVFGSSGPETQPRVAAVGRSVDELVRVNGHWLIKSRDVAPKD
jgi:uncharacterized protein (TIGR02246 family)